ncbi:MAG: glycosyltransferase [Mycobacterium sp.]|nr:glycosyltransferase [Mycobacterium sp.]MBV9722140.1 glycosyltransferase [Mycobacterium sp.]
MKFVVVGYGSRGDVEPCAAVARELLRRGHEVRLAVPRMMLGFVKSAGIAAVAYGPDSDAVLQDLVSVLRNPLSASPHVAAHVNQIKAEKDATLKALVDGADLLLAGITEQPLAANVANQYRIPLAALHFFPTQFLQPGSLQVSGPSARPLEIQAYDGLCFPELAHDDDRRPFVGALTLELPTDHDDDVLAWIAAGTPPIYFGFGDITVESPSDLVAVITETCAQIGERALVCSGPNDIAGISYLDHVKVVPTVNHATVFPACRAVVHHGGAGTTAAGLRAGIPSLILWNGLDQPMWADAVERLKVGRGGHFPKTTVESLVADLRALLAPEYLTRAREVAALMNKPVDSVASCADLLEHTARGGRVD